MTAKTETRSTLALTVGDIVCHYGARLRLTERREYPDNVIAFATEYVGPVTPDRDPVAEWGGYGRLMVTNQWRIQGNDYATWSVEA